MSTIAFHRRLREKLAETIANETDRITSGEYRDYAVYREQVGYLRALKTVLDLAEEIERGMT